MNFGRFACLLKLSAVLLAVSACSAAREQPRGGLCDDATECFPGQICRDMHCIDLDASVPNDGESADLARDGGTPTDLGMSSIDGGACAGDLHCQNDTRCVEGVCTPWGPGEHDPLCTRLAADGPLRPQLQCTWSGPPDGDAVPDYVNVDHTPIVANIGVQISPEIPSRPSIIFVSDHSYGESYPMCFSAGTLRVIDGATCEEQGSVTAMEDRVIAPVAPAVGDVDGDGRADIVAPGAMGGMLAFTWDPVAGNLVRMWRSHTSEGSPDLYNKPCEWGAVTLADLNDDGLPEIFFGGAVWSNEGEFYGAVPGFTGGGFIHGGMPIPIADVDLDGRAELISAEGTWEWNDASHAFVRESYSTTGGNGFIAIADFGSFPDFAGDGEGFPEVAAVAAGVFRLQTIGGRQILSGPARGRSGGGPPTIADYDGDGKPEIGAAFGNFYAVFDPELEDTLWQQPSSDRSSAVTSSSVFDFNGDGRAEVVYGDECFVRIYDGPTGEVLFSQARFSPTWNENPVIADVDSDSAAEVVMPISGDCNPSYCGEWDPIFAGMHCEFNEDCPSNVCDEGLCRCTSDDECGGFYACTDELDGTPGSGNVCRARHDTCGGGVRVYRDAFDRWAPSRQIWNQHAYSVTNVNDDGTIPRTSAMVNNWQDSSLNNFRQNVQSNFPSPGADLTVRSLTATCQDDNTLLSADVCNRGAALVDMGIEIIFRQEGGDELCRLRTTEPISGGVCTNVMCVAPVRADGVFEAVVDPDAIILECQESNNDGSGLANCLL